MRSFRALCAVATCWAVAMALAACGGGGSGGAVAPSIGTQPAPATVGDNSIANFSVGVAGDGPLAYQWRRDGADLVDGAGVSGATAPALALTAPYAFNASQISVRVSNAAGDAVSANALLTVTAVAPSITAQPVNTSVGVGSPATFALAVTGGTAPVTFQWKRNGVAIAGATAANYTLATAATGDNGASFSVDVINPAGTLASTAATLRVTAAGKTWGAAQFISSGDAPRSPRYPEVVIDSAGNAITVWQEESSGNVRNAAWARRSVAGGAWSAAVTIDQPVGNALQPRIAIAPSGTAVATFAQSTDNNGGGIQVFANRFNGSWGAPQRLEADIFGRANSPYVGLASDGAATVVFGLPDDTSPRVWANRSTAAGAFSGPALVGGAFANAVQVAVAGNGQAVMTWLQPTGTGAARSSLWASRNLGATWTAPVQIAADEDAVSPLRVAADANGNAVAVWQQNMANRATIRAARLDAASGLWSAPVTLNHSTQWGYEPELAIDAAGNATVVWYAANDASQAQRVANLGVLANRFSASTAAWSGAVAVQPNTTPRGFASHVAVDGAGNAIAVWLQPAPGSATRSEVWSAQFDAAGAGWAAPLKLMTDAAAYVQGGSDQRPRVAVNANGEAVVVWYQRVDAATGTGVWARAYR
jgi:hypothetical protein